MNECWGWSRGRSLCCYMNPLAGCAVVGIEMEPYFDYDSRNNKKGEDSKNGAWCPIILLHVNTRTNLLTSALTYTSAALQHVSIIETVLRKGCKRTQTPFSLILFEHSGLQSGTTRWKSSFSDFTQPEVRNQHNKLYLRLCNYFWTVLYCCALQPFAWFLSSHLFSVQGWIFCHLPFVLWSQSRHSHFLCFHQPQQVCTVFNTMLCTVADWSGGTCMKWAALGPLRKVLTSHTNDLIFDSVVLCLIKKPSKKYAHTTP